MKKESFLGRPVKHHSPARDYPRSASRDRPIEHPENLTREEREAKEWLEWRAWMEGDHRTERRGEAELEQKKEIEENRLSDEDVERLLRKRIEEAEQLRVEKLKRSKRSWKYKYNTISPYYKRP